MTESDSISQVYDAFAPLDSDVVLHKSQYYAEDGNSLEEILHRQKFDTEIFVCFLIIIIPSRSFANETRDSPAFAHRALS
jgi:isochorismate hydrolase